MPRWSCKRRAFAGVHSKSAEHGRVHSKSAEHARVQLVYSCGRAVQVTDRDTSGILGSTDLCNSHERHSNQLHCKMLAASVSQWCGFPIHKMLYAALGGAHKI